MPKAESFDITTGVDLQEVDNAVNQARKEIANRFDFKNLIAEIDYDRKIPKLTVRTTDEYKLDAIWQALTQRLSDQGMDADTVTYPAASLCLESSFDDEERSQGFRQDDRGATRKTRIQVSLGLHHLNALGRPS